MSDQPYKNPMRGKGAVVPGHVEGLDYYTPVSITLTLLYNIISAMSAIANLLHLFILSYMGRGKRQRALPNNYRVFLIVLAVSDLVVAIARVTFSNKANQEMMISSRFYCVFSATLVHCCLLTGSTLILLVSIERVLAFTESSLYSKTWYARHFTKLIVGVIILFLVVFTSLGVLYGDAGYRVKGLGACKMSSEKMKFLSMVSSGIVFVELLVICISYGVLLRRTRRAIGKSLLLRQATRRKKDITMSIGAIFACKIVTWLPIMLTIVMRSLEIHCTACEWVGLLTMAINPLLNPLIYGLRNKNYMRFIRAIRKKSNVTLVFPATDHTNARSFAKK